jgi:hypothetical protein
MTTTLPPIFFYISHYDWILENLPEIVDASEFSLDEGKISKFMSFFFRYNIENFDDSELQQNLDKNFSPHPICSGEFSWTLQTYLRLKSIGFPCKLIGTFPTEGIVLAHHSDSIPWNFYPGSKLLFVYLKGDRVQHNYAQIQVVQNIHETKRFKNAYYIPLWTQAGLIPRENSREDRFEKIAFLGKKCNLAPELLNSSWSEKLKSIGLQWCIKHSYQWHDYSDVDAIIAIRDFETEGIAEKISRKPATKLYNAWHANVPAILGREPAFQEERRSDLDYIEVTSLDEVLLALKSLRDDKNLRQAMVENGRCRARETENSRIITQWCEFLTEEVVPAYSLWCNKPSVNRKIFFARKRFLSIVYGSNTLIYKVNRRIFFTHKRFRLKLKGLQRRFLSFTTK